MIQNLLPVSKDETFPYLPFHDIHDIYEILIIAGEVAILCHVLDLIGAIFLFFLRRSAGYFFAAALVVELLYFAYLISFGNGWQSIQAGGLVGLYRFAVEISLFRYVVYLVKKGLLQ
jgi:hypothetical protein